MSEYANVEKPFLDQLSALGWQVHQSKGEIAKSLRTNRQEVILKERFRESLDRLNCQPNGQPWLTEAQKTEVFQALIDIETSARKLHEANKAVAALLRDGYTVAQNEVTKEKNVRVNLVDLDHWQRNTFDAVSQFQIDTPGRVNNCIKPDIVLFVNGLPWVVVECKDEEVAEPLSEAFRQIKRYENQRKDDKYNQNALEGAPRLFYYSLFNIITHGQEARVGTISGQMQHYNNWRDIFPSHYKTKPIEPYDPQKHPIDPAVHQNITIHGLLNKEILLDVFQNFTLFIQLDDLPEIKIICRYQQYRAVGKIIERLRQETTPQTRSGTVWHTQGSGKSFTMAFLIRKLRNLADLKDYKILVVTDRTNLENQLLGTVTYANETVGRISKRAELAQKLANDNSDLHMVMIHKFLEEEEKHAQSLKKREKDPNNVPTYQEFPTVNDSERILILVDEAHRTQGGDMAYNLFTAFPRSVKIGFTGTPLFTRQDRKNTQDRFGKFVDIYGLRQAVRDRATVNIKYLGKSSKDELNALGLDFAFENEFSHLTEREKKEITRRYGSVEAYLESDDHIVKNARDIVDHYIATVLPDGFKAQVVATSRVAAARYEVQILAAIQARIAQEEAKPQPDQSLIKKLKFLDACTVISTIGNDLGYLVEAEAKAKRMKAETNFKKAFDYNKKETGIAFLCVCDRLLTGFDAPIEQVMYLDKNLKEHDLLQAIARVNRTYKGKSHGLLVDYFGITKNLQAALAIYDREDLESEEWKEFTEYFQDINKEIPILKDRYERLMQFFVEKGYIHDIEDFVNQRLKDEDRKLDIVEECVEAAADVRFRAEFDVLLKHFLDSLDMLFNVPEARQYRIPGKLLGYLANRIRQRYRDPTMDLKWAKGKVRRMIDDHLTSLGVEIQVDLVELFSDDFPKDLERNTRTPKAKASEMEHAIRRHIKDNLQDDEALYKRFGEKMEEILKNHQDNWEQIAIELGHLRNDMRQGRQGDQNLGLNKEGMFYLELLSTQALGKRLPELSDSEKQQIAAIVKQILIILEDYLSIPNLWEKGSKVRELKGKLEDYLEIESGYEAIQTEAPVITNQVIQATKKRKPK